MQMIQATLAFPASQAAVSGATATTIDDATGFDIGWDHAHHGLVPPAELLLDTTSIGQGWRAGRAVFGRRTLSSHRHTRAWLALRIQAWREGVPFDAQQVNPAYLAQLDTPRCPVRRTPLGGPHGHDDAAVIERLNPRAAYAAGNLVVMSHRAAQARAGLDVLDTLRRGRAAERGGEPVAGLDAGAWWRLATLQACTTPLPFHEAASLPMAVLPPNRVRVLNASQGLQAWVTRLFLAPGWSARTRALAQLLPAHTLRTDFNLFIGALAPRVIEAGTEPLALRHALEDAWLHERVQRRWQHFILSLGEAGTEALLQRAAEAGGSGVRAVCHPWAQATENWGLTQRSEPRGDPMRAARASAARRPAYRPTRAAVTALGASA
jgi:hypothetical protein